MRITILFLALEAKESFLYKSSRLNTPLSNFQTFLLSLAAGASIVALVFGTSRDILRPNWPATLQLCGLPKPAISQPKVYCSMLSNNSW